MAIGCGHKTSRQAVPAIELSNMDSTVNPADDFYRYCNGNWLKSNQIPEDLHAPHEARVNRTLGSMPHFYEAFDIPEGSKMFIDPEERAAIW